MDSSIKISAYSDLTSRILDYPQYITNWFLNKPVIVVACNLEIDMVYLPLYSRLLWIVGHFESFRKKTRREKYVNIRCICIITTFYCLMHIRGIFIFVMQYLWGLVILIMINDYRDEFSISFLHSKVLETFPTKITFPETKMFVRIVLPFKGWIGRKFPPSGARGSDISPCTNLRSVCN